MVRQALLSMEFLRQEYWNRLPVPSPGAFPDLDIELASLASPALTGAVFTTAPPGKPKDSISDSSERLLQIGSGGKVNI